MTKPKSSTSPAAEALRDVFEAFENEFHVKFTGDGYATAEALFDGSLGQFLRELARLNPRRRLWSEPDLKELPNFILGYVVAEIAFELKSASGGGSAGSEQVGTVATAVMGAKHTKHYCRVMLNSYFKKVEHVDKKTPICSLRIFR